MTKGAPVEDFQIAGVGVYTWVELYNSYQHVSAWPDGGSTLSQPAIAIAVFRIIESQQRKMSERGGASG